MENTRSILITGASTGIGRACALRLEKEGFRVFAGVRKKADAAALKKASSGRLVPVMIDVTDGKSIAAAVKAVSKITGGELYGLMSNAGIGGGTVMELTPMDVIREVIEVNLVAAFAVTRAFLPLLRKGKGRILFTGSISGIAAAPGFSAYAASKHGIEGLADALRLELKPFGITVSVLEPGIIKTDIWRKGFDLNDKIARKADPEIYKLYEKPILNYSKKHEEGYFKYLLPEAVADRAYHAFSARKPGYRYLVGSDAKFMSLLEHLPVNIRDSFYYRMVYK